MNEEQRLIELSKTDANAFGSLYERYYDEILNYALRRTGSAETAKDITAETFFKALKNIHKFTWQGVPLSAWLYRICGNEIAAYYRKGSYRSVSMESLMSKGFDLASPYNLEDEIIAAETALEQHRALRMYSEALRKLPQKFQDVIALRYFADKKIGEIADILEKPEGSIKSLLHRGLGKLKREILVKCATFCGKSHYESREE